MGGVNLDQRTASYRGLVMAGIEGCNRYNFGPVQYSQSEYWTMVLGMVPKLFRNRLKYGRFLDVLITHAPPWGIHDLTDLAHQGIKSFRWLLDVFKPYYHFHGHVHHYKTMGIRETLYKETLVINAYGYREVLIRPGGRLVPVVTPPEAGSPPAGEPRSKNGEAGPPDSGAPQSG